MDSTAVEQTQRPHEAARDQEAVTEAAAGSEPEAGTADHRNGAFGAAARESGDCASPPLSAGTEAAGAGPGGTASTNTASTNTESTSTESTSTAATGVVSTITAPAGTATGSDRDRALGLRVIAGVIALCVFVAGWALAHVVSSTGSRPSSARGKQVSPAPPRLVQQLAGTFTIPGSAPAIPWPSVGQAAIEMEGYGSLGTSGNVSTPVPIASVTKTMTAYLILAHHPLTAGESGPLITVSSADAAAYQSEKAQGQSLVKVYAGERITERDALEALMLASADNIAKILARWDAGSVPTFVREMNTAARGLGMSQTTYTDPSGLDPSTVSTAPDQVKLGQAAMQSATFRQIVGQQSATVPVAGTIWNFNRLVGHDGVTGIKTGSTDQAGGCLLFADTVTLGGRDETVIGVVLGQPLGTGATFLDRTLGTASKMITAAQGTLAAATVAMPGEPAASIHRGGSASQSPLGVAAPLVVVGKPGQTYRVSVSWGTSTPVVKVAALDTTGSATTGSLSVPLVRLVPRSALPAG